MSFKEEVVNVPQIRTECRMFCRSGQSRSICFTVNGAYQTS